MRNPKALAVARSWLDDAVCAALKNNELRLPTLVHAAALAGVSHVTMMKAVREMRERGVVSVRQRGGIRVEAAPFEATAPSGTSVTTGPRWRALALRLGREVLSGRFSPGAQLPPGKVLSVRYATTPNTMRKALLSLERDGIIESSKRGYRIAQLRSAGGADCIALIARGESALQLMDVSERSFTMVRALEEECMRSGVRLLCVPCYFEGNRIQGLDLLTGHLNAPDSTRNILGVMVWSAGLPHEFVPELRSFIQRTELPVALLNDSYEPEWEAFRSMSRVRVFSQAFSARAGETAGRFLRGLGHRRVAFIHTDGQAAFARRRLAGVRAAFAPLGPDAEVISVLVKERAHTPDHLDRLLAELSGSVSRCVDYNPDITVQHNAVEYGALSRIALGVSVSMRDHQSRRSLFARLEQAQAVQRASAWVAASDKIALDCLDYLQGRSVRVPQDISVMGFDNGQLATAHRLTSCDFNGTAYVRAMLEYLLRPGRRSTNATAKTPLEIDPIVVARRTTGPAPRDG